MEITVVFLHMQHIGPSVVVYIRLSFALVKTSFPIFLFPFSLCYILAESCRKSLEDDRFIVYTDNSVQFSSILFYHSVHIVLCTGLNKSCMFFSKNGDTV